MARSSFGGGLSRRKRLVLALLLAGIILLIVEIRWRSQLIGSVLDIDLLSAGAARTRVEGTSRPLPPLAPLSTARRMVLADKLRSIPDFFARVTGPATIQNYTPHEIPQIVEGLAQKAKGVPGALSRELASITSYFKHAGLSGWNDTGRDVVIDAWISTDEPGVGDDQMLTADLQIVRLAIDGEDVTGLIQGTRYMRMEVFGGVLREIERRPQLNDCLHVAGALRVDNDAEGFYEVHPLQASDIQIVECSTIGIQR